MKAITISKFGGLDVIQLTTVPVPVAAAGEVLIKTSYAGVNPVDYKIREGYLQGMMPHAFPLILGWDTAGQVAAVGAGVTGFKVGDRVYAYARKPTVQAGTYAEYVTVEAANLALTPRQLPDEQAAGVPLTALTAWQAIFDFAQLKAGQTLLIHAGAGGVGSFAIQLAKAAGATVIATASAENHDYLRTLGADVALDYRKDDLHASIKNLYPDGLDVVLDGVGGSTLTSSYGLVKRGGALVSIVDTPDAEKSSAYGIRASFIFVAPSGEQLTKISAMIAEGLVKAPRTEVLPLAMAAEAHRKSESRRTVGKIVLKI